MGALLAVMAAAISLRPSRPDALAGYLLPHPSAAPELTLTDADGERLSLGTLRGRPVMVFFGYTHCPDVCPTTLGEMVMAFADYGSGARALFVSIDPERDTVAWLGEYRRYLAPGIIPLTGSPAEIQAVADAWGARYARVEAGGGDYAMSHTADVYVVDPSGLLRARLPFGTPAETMTAVLRRVAPGGARTAAGGGAPSSPTATSVPTATGAPTPTPVPPGTPAPTSGSSVPAAAQLEVEVRSTSVWAGGGSPVALALYQDDERLDDSTATVDVQVVALDGTIAKPPVRAEAVRPPGVPELSFVAALDLPTPGDWRLSVTATAAGQRLAGIATVTARDPGTTAALGRPAPTAHTPTLDDVGGLARAITTDPLPDLRLYQRSTSDALADHQPFVLIVDSPRFKVSQECGRAVLLGRYLQDRWRDVAFIHLEPLRYTLVADTPHLDGTLEHPTLTDVAAAWGIGGAPWGPRSMPWVFVVDEDGIVRGKYVGVIGTEDVDVLLAMMVSAHG
jgi:protein SCO1/2